MRMHEGQQERMETEHKLGNIEDGNKGCCVQVKRSCVKLEDGLAPRSTVSLCRSGGILCTWKGIRAHINISLPFVSLPTHSSLPQMFKFPSGMHYLLSCLIYTQTALQVQLHSKPSFHSTTPCVPLHLPSFPKQH